MNRKTREKYWKITLRASSPRLHFGFLHLVIKVRQCRTIISLDQFSAGTLQEKNSHQWKETDCHLPRDYKYSINFALKRLFFICSSIWISNKWLKSFRIRIVWNLRSKHIHYEHFVDFLYGKIYYRNEKSSTFDSLNVRTWSGWRQYWNRKYTKRKVHSDVFECTQTMTI